MLSIMVLVVNAEEPSMEVEMAEEEGISCRGMMGVGTPMGAMVSGRIWSLLRKWPRNRRLRRSTRMRMGF